MAFPKKLHHVDDCFDHAVPSGARRLAWDGISFCIPQNWELGNYKYQRRGIGRIEVEDEYARRLDSEWIRSDKTLQLDRIMQRYEKAARPLTIKAEQSVMLDDLPPGWHATHFIFKETGIEKNASLQVVRHDLVTAFYLDPKHGLFCFFMLHFLPEDKEDPVVITRLLTGTFQDHQNASLIPWQLFDIGFKLPPSFHLVRTSFDIGAKMMHFEQKGQRLFLWHYSCADIVLKDMVSPEQWAVGYLNAFRGIRGITFSILPQGGIGWRRRLPYLFGHMDELFRWCFLYDAGCRLLNEKNQLFVWVYHHRHHHDMHSRFALCR